jgi:hypothetical protein
MPDPSYMAKSTSNHNGFQVLPTVSVFQGSFKYKNYKYRNTSNTATALHFNTEITLKQVKFFWTAFTGMFIYEVIPAYMFPLLNAVNVFCLASQGASQKTVDIFTNIFGGASGNEGLGLLSFSFDWQYIGSA